MSMEKLSKSNLETKSRPEIRNNAKSLSGIDSKPPLAKNLVRVDKSEHVNRLKANTIYKEGRYQTQTDGVPRIVRKTFSCELSDKPRTAKDLAATRDVGNKGRIGDDGGHIKAHSFDGKSDRLNLFPQDSNFNRGAYKALENKIRNDVQSGKNVRADVRFQYPSETSKRPSIVTVRTFTDGIQKTYRFRNERGG